MNDDILDIHSTLEKIETKHISSAVKDLISTMGMKASHSRHVIISHILENPHKYFTAKEMYESLYKYIPSLSKATVYNTLNALREKKVLKDLKTDQKEAIFYLSLSSSIAHFTCINCKQMHPIELGNFKDILEESIEKGYIANSVDIFLTGICSSCNEKNKTKKNTLT